MRMIIQPRVCIDVCAWENYRVCYLLWVKTLNLYNKLRDLNKSQFKSISTKVVRTASWGRAVSIWSDHVSSLQTKTDL